MPDRRMVTRIAILGSTGSVGRSTLEVVSRHPERFQVRALTANRSVDLLREQAERHGAQTVVVADLEHFGSLGSAPSGWNGGREALLDVVRDPEIDVVVNALVGFAGLEPTLEALRTGKRVALANKESLVAGGDLVMAALDEGGGELVPVDSEHSAILQCMNGGERRTVSRLLLTASGGPFRGWDATRLDSVGPGDALKHPTWSMGAKISIDSATLANKALEVIEAHVLYRIPYESIEVVVHPQSVIHSMVEFVDGSVMAQMGFPTMELPILYALSFPERIDDPNLRTFDAVRSSPLTFEAIDHDAFPMFGVGTDAGRRGGLAPAIFNAANEIAVAAFLEERIPFPAMAEAVRDAIEGLMGTSDDPISLGGVQESDREARRFVRDWISRHDS
ncbi:MAG: 1-deoxy-D-xylulose-5-phosphate reductoisomerase [Gemmatimonadales bacterium]|nr:MAG: 1-deoxy-D-xylulose-5-phosphate reductoisomerase [Gemmatimonadales bacterium]